MRIHFPLLSIASTAVLIGAILLGGKVSIYDLHLSVASTEEGISVSLHPTFLCWMDVPDHLFRGGCFGNLVICDYTQPSEARRMRTIAHEARHLEQWRALGIWTWAAQYILPLEPSSHDLPDLQEELSQMWQPPEGWMDQWVFLRVGIDR